MAVNLNNIENSKLGVGISYNVIPPLFETNFAIGVAAVNPLVRFDPAFTIDAIVYLTN
jgi:hypothetical protein